MELSKAVEQYKIFEFKAEGSQAGNPFKAAEIWGDFKSEREQKKVRGFYNGNGMYIVRFMPFFTGEYTYKIYGSFSDKAYEGTFNVTKAGENNHGMVRVANQFHLSYEDGTPYYQFGTTAYAWTHQPYNMREQTLKTLSESPFNKIRFCIFPKHYDYNLYEPVTYPYEGTPCGIENLNRDNFLEFLPDNPENKWDFYRFNPKHFEILDKCIQDLDELGIEADIILFHPYDRWGFSEMGREADAFYTRYVIARYSAYKNVWWSLANEYDLCTKKTIEDWENIADIIVNEDSYSHLRSIHNCKLIYDFRKPWITHCSLQRNEIYLSAANTAKWREEYQKPVILDEVGYEGNINYFWGNLTAKEMVRLFWAAAVRGGYCGHGETYVSEDNKLWWSHGNVLKGKSAKRIKFLADIIKEVPGHGLCPANLKKWDDNCATAEHIGYKNKYYLFYTDRYRPSFREFYFDDENEYQVEVIDTWKMTIENRGIYKGKFEIDLPSKSYMAIRIQRI